MSRYNEFISGKVVTAHSSGFQIDPSELHPSLYPHQRDISTWAIHGGSRAIFASFGLGKTRINIEVSRQIINRDGGKALFVAPLGVRQEFTRVEGPAMGVKIQYCTNMEEVRTAQTPYVITNYERIRNGDIIPAEFTVVSLDEASVLRSTGSDTFEAFMTLCEDVKYKFVYTATPSPNRFIELINYAHFLGVMDRGQALTRFFKRDSQKAGNLKIHPHKEREFWLWVCSWSVMIYRPSDLGYSDEGYDLPELEVIWHEIPADHTKAWDKTDENGQRFLIQHEAMGITASAAEKRDTITQRLEKAKEVLSTYGPENNWLLWHHLEGERAAIEKALPHSKSVYGNLDLETREDRILAFSNGEIQILNTKPELSGSGCNFQRHCYQNLFLGINYDFNDFIQAIHRTHRFQQKHPVQVHIIHTEIERAIVTELKQKWARHLELQSNMRAIVSEHGLNNLAMVKSLQRTATVNRQVSTGKDWEFVNNDCVLELQGMEDNSVGMVLTSIPFSNHYEYTPSYLDFGHTDNDNHFFSQMDYLIPELLRVTQPGRMACIHVKDRIFYGSQTGTGFSTVNPFHAKTLFAFMQHGWEYMGMAIIPTDVVAENNQTYRLTYGEMVKDGTKMGFGSPEFLLVFRKPQSDKSKAYADVPVVKNREEYSLGRWQIDADAIWRSSGNRLLDIKSLVKMANSDKGLSKVRKEFSDFFNSVGYDYKKHVEIAEALGEANRLPKVFSLVTPPLSEAQKEHIWDDVLRMRTLNMSQALRKKEQHVCPLQLDIIERSIERYTNPGDLVFDPFGGIASVPYMAIKMNRKGKATELNSDYWKDGCFYLRQAEAECNVPTLFDFKAA
jgi:DNA modification methylase